jgi:Leucine-rich repeat (LRR) protein
MCVVVMMAVLVVLQLSACWALSSTPVNQTLALQHLYDATNGPNWDYTLDGDPWNFSQPLELTDPCLGWDGITCQCNNSNSNSGEICNIIGLSMFWASMEGPLTPTLSMLQHLTHLNLGFNSLTGEIPPEIFTLSSLELLYLGRNVLTGSVPEDITRLTSLTFLDLFENLFSGTLSQNFHNWDNIQVGEFEC